MQFSMLRRHLKDVNCGSERMGIGANRIESINIPEYGISSVEFAANVSFLLSYSSSSSRYCKNNNGNFYVHTSLIQQLSLAVFD